MTSPTHEPSVEPHTTTREWTLPVELADLLKPMPANTLVLVPQDRRHDGKFLLPQTSKSVVKLFRSHDVPVIVPVDGDDVLYIDQYGFEWFGPLIFIGTAMASENTNAVSIALNLLSSYLHDLFKGHGDNGKAHLKVAVARQGTTTLKLVEYDGPVSGVKDLATAVAEALRENDQDS